MTSGTNFVRLKLKNFRHDRESVCTENIRVSAPVSMAMMVPIQNT